MSTGDGNPAAVSAPDRPIPIVEAGTGGSVAVFEAARDVAVALYERASAPYPRWQLTASDWLARRWLARNASPYAREVAAIAGRMARPGVWGLNLNYEWACTVAVGPGADGDVPRLLRTLDWGIDGLGETMVLARHQGRAGAWIDMGWPGFVGAITVFAPGRFAASINQPPMRRRVGSVPFADWILTRGDVLRSRAIPPAHLLRLVAETAPDFATARRMLAETPVCLPVFYALVGTRQDEGVVIEREETRAYEHDGPITAANHWLAPGFDDTPRTETSHERRAQLAAEMASTHDFAWVRPPILNETTRMACEASPASGRLAVRCWEGGRPVSAVTVLDEPP